MTYKQINYMYIQKESVRCILSKIACTPLRVHFSIFRSGPLFLNTIIFFFFKLTVISVCVQKSEIAFSCNCRLLTVSAPQATSSTNKIHKISGISFVIKTPLHVCRKCDTKSLIYKLNIIGELKSSPPASFRCYTCDFVT